MLYKKCYIIMFCMCFQLSYARIIQSGNGNAVIGVTTITQPGNYRLVQDIHNTIQANSIIIDADNVVLDLAGHTISGPGIAGQNDIGISINNHRNIIVKNGIINATNTDSILVNNATNLTIENISFMGNTECVLIDTSTLITMQECTFKNNNSSVSSTLVSIDQSNDVTINNCAVLENNIVYAFLISTCNGLIINNISMLKNNSDTQFIGLWIYDCNTVVINNVEVNKNTAIGGINDTAALRIQTSSNCIVEDCTASDNIVGIGNGRFVYFLNVSNFSINNCQVINNTLNPIDDPNIQAAYEFLNTFNGVIRNCTANANNFSTGSPGSPTAAMIRINSSKNLIVENMEIENNTLSIAQYNMVDLISSSSVLLDKSVTTSNHNTGSLKCISIRFDSHNNIILNSIIKNNISLDPISIMEGIDIQGNHNIVNNNIVSTNIGTAGSVGIGTTGINTILQNQSENQTFNYASGGSTIIPIATYNRSSGTIVPSGVDTLTYDNIEMVTL